jgi:hypothetical protein
MDKGLPVLNPAQVMLYGATVAPITAGSGAGAARVPRIRLLAEKVRAEKAIPLVS